MKEDEAVIDDRDEDDMGEVLSEEERQDQRREAMFNFANSLLKKRDEAVAHRAASGVEKRWREDQDLFEGVDENTKSSSMLDYATGSAPAKNRKSAVRSTVIVNIVRNKTEVAAGRFCDILMPTDDKNWELEPTPVPELGQKIKDERPAMQAGQPITDEKGQQATVAQVTADIMAQARGKMEGMEAEVDDQLSESKYNGECRKIVFDAARLGTGVLKGPSVIKRYSQRWQPVRGTDPETGEPITVHEMRMVAEHKPASKRVDPWNVYPDPTCGSDVAKARYMWERDTISQRDASKLKGLDGYFDDQIKLALSEPPRRTVVEFDKGGQSLIAKQTEIEKGQLYEVWEYSGEVNSDDLEIIGFESEEELGEDANVSVSVVFINEHPVKVALNVLETGDLQYDFFQWSEMADSPWGAGVPRIIIFTQRILTAAWRAMMDNAGDTAGAVRVIRRRDVEPADGNWNITRNKLLLYMGDDDVRQVFTQFQLDGRQGELQAIIELALRFADMETGIPSLFQGEGKTAPETLGATNIMVDSNNISLRLRAKRFDDQVTDRHLTRYYHYNMMYNPKEHIKGDFQVNPRGVRVLLERDQQAQSIIMVLPILADPEISKEVDKVKMARQLFGALRLDILKSEEEKAGEKQEQQAEQGQQVDPGMQAAQVRSQAQIEVAKLNQQSDMAELKLKQEMAQSDREHQERMKAQDLQIEMMKMANARNISIDSIKAALASDTMKLQTQKELSAGKAVPQVATPPTEPIGQAPAGQAYQR
jgi:hypothetical protein